MPKFETNSSSWKTPAVVVDGAAVLSVTFNEKAKTTEIALKQGASYVALADFAYETDTPDVIPVKGSVEDVKKKLGL